VLRFDLWRGLRKNKDSQKVTKVLYFTYLGISPGTDLPKICMWGHVPDIITCAKFQKEILKVCDSAGGWNFHFPIDFWMPAILLIIIVVVTYCLYNFTQVFKNDMRYINSRFTYFTYLLTQVQNLMQKAQRSQSECSRQLIKEVISHRHILVSSWLLVNCHCCVSLCSELHISKLLVFVLSVCYLKKNNDSNMPVNLWLHDVVRVTRRQFFPYHKWPSYGIWSVIFWGHWTR